MRCFMVIILLVLSVSWSMTLEEAIDIALKNNTQVKLSELDLKRVEEDIRKARAGILPQVSLSYSYTKLDKSLAFGFTPTERQSYVFGVNQSIFDKAVFDAIKLSKLTKDLQAYVLEDVKRTVENQTKQLFYALLYKKEVVKLYKDNLSYWEENYKLTKVQYEAGVVPVVNLLRSKAQLQTAEAQYQQALADYKKSLEDFKAYLRWDEDIQPEGSLEFKPFQEDYPTLRKLLLERNSTLLVAKKSVEVYEKRIDVAKDAYYPTISGFVTYQGNTGRRSLSGGTEWIRGYTFGFQLNYNLFDGFQREANIAQANIDYLKQKEVYIDTLYTQDAQMKKTLEDINSLKAQIRALESSLEAAKEALRLSTERYRYGVTNQLEVLESRANYNQTLQNYYLLLYQYMSDLANIERLTK
ncbi:Outer membrane protein OprM [bacterium HR13]|nr:Outer membrane protein OprM [bacterium HR13]